VTTKQGDASQSDVGTQATYDVEGTLEPDEAHAYGPHRLAAGETTTVDITWDAAASDFCLGIMDSDGNAYCVVQEDGSGSVTVEAEESGDYYAFIWNQGPYTSDYSGYYRV